MATVTIHEAKTHLSRLIARAEAGEEIVIARGKDPVVRLALVKAQAEPRQGGWLKGIPPIPDSVFFDPLPEDELRLWEGHGRDPMDPDWDPSKR